MSGLNWTEADLKRHMAQFPSEVATAEPARKERSFMPRGRKQNKHEAAYAAFLEQQKQAGLIAGYRFEAITLLLADGCRYTPDFVITTLSGAIAAHEVKARRRRKSGIVGPHLEDDARVKILTAAKLFPEFRFRLAWLDGAQWRIEEIAG